VWFHRISGAVIFVLFIFSAHRSIDMCDSKSSTKKEATLCVWYMIRQKQ
jgi:hypothetical protein